MKQCILTPTYPEHFQYAKNLLISFKKYVTDKDNFDYVIVTGTRAESDHFVSLIDQFPHVRVYNLEDILSHYGIFVHPDELLKEVGKFSYQTIKKLYALFYLDYDRFLVLDSESLFLRKTSLADLFKDWEQNKTIYYSHMDAHDMRMYSSWLDYRTSKHCAELLGYKFELKWWFETFTWIYEKKIVNDLFAKFEGNLFDVIYQFAKKQEKRVDKAIFEIILYNQFVSHNAERYNYALVNILSELETSLTTLRFNIMRKKMEKCKILHLPLGNFPFFIHGWEFLNYRDIKIWGKIYRNHKLFAARLWLGKIKPREIAKWYFLQETGIVIGTSTELISTEDDISQLTKWKFFSLWKAIFSFLNPKNSLFGR